MKKIIVVLGTFCLFLSCQLKKDNNNVVEDPNEGSVQVINLLSHLDDESSPFLLSEVASDIEIVPLETNEGLLYKIVYNLVVTDNNIFINTTGRVARYDRTGKYLNSIGNIGQGPGEYLFCRGIGVNEEENILYVADLGSQNRVFSYSLDGQLINQVKIAPNGAYMLGIQGEEYCFIDNQHLIKRMLPCYDGSEDYWMLQFIDTTGEKTATFYNPVDIGHEEGFTQHKLKWGDTAWDYWSEDGVRLNCYKDQVNFVFYDNDTVYSYDRKKLELSPKYILNCGERPAFEKAHKVVKDYSFFKYLMIMNMLDTKDFVYFICGKDEYKYMFRYSKSDGTIKVIKEKFGIIERKMNEKVTLLMHSSHSPHFVNDLSGGLSFYPDYQDGKCWIALYEASELLEKLNINDLRKEDVIYPQKRDSLINIVQKLKEDDNPVLMIVHLK